jgi:hypothetical protein
MKKGTIVSTIGHTLTWPFIELRSPAPYFIAGLGSFWYPFFTEPFRGVLVEKTIEQEGNIRKEVKELKWATPYKGLISGTATSSVFSIRKISGWIQPYKLAYQPVKFILFDNILTRYLDKMWDNVSEVDTTKLSGKQVYD